MRTDFIRRTLTVPFRGLSLTVAFCLAWTGLAATQALCASAPVSVVAFGAVADGVMRKDGAMSPNSPLLTSASGSFTSADQGKYIQVIGAGPGGTARTDGVIGAGSAVLTSGSSGFVPSDVGRCIVVSGAGAGGGNLVGRIQSFNSPSSVTLSVSAQTSVSGVFFNYGGMTLEATIQSVQSSSAVTLSAPASALISAATYAYGTDNHTAFQLAVDTVGESGGGQVSVPAPSTCAGGAVCGYVVKASDQQTAQAPGAVKIRYSNVSLVGDAPQTNLFCRGAFGVYSNTVAYPGTTGNIRGFCLNIGDNGGPNGAAGEAVSNVTISQLHLYGMTNGNTFNVNFAYPPTTPTGDGWDVTHKAIYMWDNSAFSNIVINSVIIQDFKAENIYSGGSVVTGMVIENSTMTNFNGNGISMLAASLQALNNTISNGSNAAVENSTVSMGSQALVSQLYQGNTISLIPREGIVVVGVDNGVAAGTVKILNNTFDTIAQINPSGTESAIYIASQNNYIPPANVTVTGNTCHDCQTFGVFQTSGNTVIQGNNFIVDHYNAGSVFGFTNALNNVTISNNTGSSTAQAQAANLNVGAVYELNPGYANGSFAWKNVIVTGNSWNFPGAPQYQFVTSSGAGWNLVTQDNLRWEGDVCTGCTHADGDHGLVNLSGTTTIRPYGPVVYVNGNNSPVNATVDASKEEDGSQVQIFNAGGNPVNFSSDNNLSLPSTYSLQPGSSLNLLYSAAVGRFTLPNAAINVSATAGTPQSVTVNKAFATALQATVTNSSNAPMSGVTVTFAAPSSGSSATFSGSASAVAVTGSNGVATAPALTANGQAGAYVVTASVAGAGTSATYSLTNTPVAGNGNGALTGTGTSSIATVNLTTEGGNDWVHWGDSGLTRKAGVTAQLSSYTPIGSGAVLTYSNDPRPVSWTDGTPLASATNNTNGLYVAGTGLGFSFTAPADTTSRTLTVHVGGWFSAGAFTAHLSDGSAADFTDVTAVASGQYDRNYTLVYQAGAAGQSLTVSWVMTAGAGYGNVTLNAAAVAGAASPAITITSTAGTPQSATIGTAFATALQATVKDSNNNPISGVSVTFAAPSTGASATFGGSSSVVAVTGSTGVATAPTLTANSQTGGYLVVASVAGATSSASFSLTNTAPAVLSISATGGTPQSAAIGTAFATALQATVKDSNNNPVSGATVTFAAPTSGASGTFGGSVTVTAVTGTTGIATAPTFTANSQAGGYLVTATVPNGASSASFSLTNTAPVTISIGATGGTPQSATVGTAFAAALQATVKDSNNNPVSGATVTFAAPTSGASGTFSGSATASAVTGTTGIATAPTFTANSQTGGYLVVATVPNGASSAPFSLTNTAIAVLSISASGGTPQSATDGTAFATPLQATVKDSNNNPVSGATVTFTAPASGASGTFAGSATVTAVTGTNGFATAPAFTANSQTGGYLVLATVPNGASSAPFSLTNTAPVTISVSATGGTPQSATVGTAFATPLQATVKDSNNNPVSGATVTFAAPTSGASGTFAGSVTITAVTGTNGIATSPTFTANSQTGTYLVAAAVANGTSSAQFSLTNIAPVTVSVSATAGTPQSATAGTTFATPLQATVKDSNNNPVSGATVTFTAPSSGASGTFGGSATVTAITGTTGIATAPAFTANSQTGTYLVAATVANGTSSAQFSLTNTAPVTISVSATGGTPQNATVGTAFATPLQATVKDSNNNPVSGATVTFTAPANGASGTFGGSATVTATTGTTGIATAPAFTANSQTGTYLVVATVPNGTSGGQFSLTNTAPALLSISATGGTPQSANIGAAFASFLQANVKDSNNNPLSGVTVTFAAPASGASGTFNGPTTVAATSGSGGIATAPPFYANSQAGSYLVVATIANGASSALFSLTNTGPVTISVSATGGTPQSATAGTTFASPLQATVKDSNNNLVSGTTVTFAAPTSGASGTFGGSSSTTAVTGTNGIATAPALTANSQTGAYAVVATIANSSSSAIFSLTNIAPVTISVTATAGTPQSATDGTAFATPLQATVKDSNNNPVSGATVTFAAPTSGASGTFSGSATVTAITGTTGIATAPALTANSQTGAYLVVATVINGASSALFSLTNIAPVTISVAATAGTPQSATVGTVFTTPLQATVKDSNNNAVSGAIVTFAAPANGASGTFSGSFTVTAISGSTGIAIAPAFTANSLTGSYLVAATVPNGASGASFSLTNTAALTISIGAAGGTPQGATVGTAFATPLQATVVNSANAPIAGATVTFTAPASGPGATFSGSVTATAVTGATGIATAPALTANSQGGSYSVVATVAGATAGATFSLTNNAAAAPPGNGALSGVGTSAATPVNLTSEGASDWIHWGDSALNRKAGVISQLSSYTPVGNGSVLAYNNDLRAVNWTDGTPTPTASNDLNGVYISGTGQGFSFTAPADTTVRTLTVHVGGWLSGGTLTAHLSDNSAADFTDVTSIAGGQYDRNYTLAYHAASASQTITVFWEMSSGSGNVTINAAALAGSPQSAPPASGSLTAIADSSSATVNLTAEGVTDWIHWGDGALNRKGSVTPLLSTYSVVGGGTVNGYANDPRPIMWTDGSPTTASTNNTDGVYINSMGNGFAFTAPADTTVRILTIHVGGWFSGGMLTAHLSDGSAADYMDSTPAVSNAFDRNYTVTYNASTAGQTLTISWIDTASGGNVTLNGAALR